MLPVKDRYYNAHQQARHEDSLDHKYEDKIDESVFRGHWLGLLENLGRLLSIRCKFEPALRIHDLKDREYRT